MAAACRPPHLGVDRSAVGRQWPVESYYCPVGLASYFVVRVRPLSLLPDRSNPGTLKFTAEIVFSRKKKEHRYTKSNKNLLRVGWIVVQLGRHRRLSSTSARRCAKPKRRERSRREDRDPVRGRPRPTSAVAWASAAGQPITWTCGRSCQ